MILVSVDPRAGKLHRYECGGSAPRLTHAWVSYVQPVSFRLELINEFYSSPSEIDRVAQTAYTPAFDYSHEPDLTPCA